MQLAKHVKKNFFLVYPKEHKACHDLLIPGCTTYTTFHFLVDVIHRQVMMEIRECIIESSYEYAWRNSMPQTYSYDLPLPEGHN